MLHSHTPVEQSSQLHLSHSVPSVITEKNSSCDARLNSGDGDKHAVLNSSSSEASPAQKVLDPPLPAPPVQQQQHSLKYRKVYYACPCGFPSLHIMNERIDGTAASLSEHYLPSLAEECANIITHLIPAIIAFFTLQGMLSTVVDTTRERVAAIIYGGACILLFSVSTIYHCTGLLFGYRSRLNRMFQTADHSMIYAFIASSYTPWLALVDFTIGTFSMSQIFLGLIWSIALFGLIKSIANVFHWIQGMVVYLFMGWISVLYLIMFFSFMALGLFETRLNMWSIVELLFSGIFYTVGGCVFFRLDGKLPFSHAIWHLFAVVAAFIHYHAIHVYVMDLE